MKFSQSKKFNSNYAAQIVNITYFESHPNPKVERMKVAKVLGCKVLVGIDYKEGLYLYFPPGCVISAEFLSKNNLFRHKELNIDKEKSGYFDDSGRVKMLKLQGFYSEGLVLSIDSLSNWLGKKVSDIEECAFDTVDNNLLCKKYIIIKEYSTNSHKPIKKPHESKVIEEQFRFHYETAQLKKTPFVIKPNSLIHCSFKEHGTSGISAYVLCKKPNTIKNKILKWLNIGSPYQYDYLWSSRKVIKNPYYNEDVNGGFYDVDIWGIAHKIIEPKLEKGLTLYYEIVGYLPNGKAIQEMGGIPFDYGCEKPLDELNYTYDKHYSIKVYRITYTNVDGQVYEFTARQVHNWCREHGLHSVKQTYYGFAKDMYTSTENIPEENFGDWFLDKMTTDTSRYMECYSPQCKNKVPHEGIVIRLEDDHSAYKVKCLKFLNGELSDLDKGLSNIEDEQCQE